MTYYYVLYFGFDLNGTSKMIELTKLAEKVVGKPSSGSGAGFGRRDVDWEFHTRSEAEAAGKRLMESPLFAGLNPEVSDVVEYGRDE